MKAKKILFIVLGCIGLGLGAVGAVVPLRRIPLRAARSGCTAGL